MAGPSSWGLGPSVALDDAAGAFDKRQRCRVGLAAQLPVSLLPVERLGDASLLYVNAGAALPTMTVRCEGAATQAPGQRMTLRLRPDQLHLFDAQGLACRRTVELPA